MNIPTFIKNLSQENYHEQLNQTLQNGLSNQGWTFPNLSSAQITEAAVSMPLGTVWYNTTINKLVVKTSSGIETISSS